jgi:dTDP-4-dehydrorhamnose reductase
MSAPLVVITGKNGQLGWELQHSVAKDSLPFTFLFTGKDELDLAVPSTIPAFFEKYQPAYFVNCAAYTAVDKAETEKETAYLINAASVGIIAEQCSKSGCTLIQLSTDYVFDGRGTHPYHSDTPTDPVNYYGYTKWIGEKLALENNTQTIIIRTSWLYSSHGNNFVKTMLRLMKEREEIKVVSDQLGSPTYAADLAEALVTVIHSLQEGNKQYGIYQYSNSGTISWFDFATAIRNEAGLLCKVLPIPTCSYPTPAKRPAYSVMDTSALVNLYGIDIKDWQKSLQTCLGKLI